MRFGLWRGGKGQTRDCILANCDLKHIPKMPKLQTIRPLRHACLRVLAGHPPKQPWRHRRAAEHTRQRTPGCPMYMSPRRAGHTRQRTPAAARKTLDRLAARERETRNPRPPASSTMPAPHPPPPPLRQRGASSSSHGPVGGLSVGTMSVRAQGFKHAFNQNLQMLAGETQLLCLQEIDNSFSQIGGGRTRILNTRTMSTRLSLGTGRAAFSWF